MLMIEWSHTHVSFQERIGRRLNPIYYFSIWNLRFTRRIGSAGS